MSIEDTSVPVVIMYVYHYGQLGAIRSLGRLGVTVRGVDPDPTAPGLFSRYCKGKVLVGCRWSKARRNCSILAEFGQKNRAKIIVDTYN